MHNSTKILEQEFEALTTTISPDVQYPPNCFQAMNGTFLQYESRSSLTASFPVSRETLNPMQKMQGGFIAAAFDNTFGPLSYLAARGLCVTLDLHTQFVRAIDVGDDLIIVAKVASRGTNTMYLTGEARNKKGKLIAACSANILVVKP